MDDIQRSISSPLMDTAAVGRRRPMKVFISALVASVFLVTLGMAVGNNIHIPSQDSPTNQSPFYSNILKLMKLPQLIPDVDIELPEKSNDHLSYDWSSTMLTWQETSFHFQYTDKWVGGPNGPLFHGGLYHIFYEYNANSSTSTNSSWGHAISTDMIHWHYLQLALVPDQWYDTNGIRSGSATKLSSGSIAMVYTGITNASETVQNLAVPANLSDPYLREWVKYSGNPILLPPGYSAGNSTSNSTGNSTVTSTSNSTDQFQGPSTAWMASNGVWYFTVGLTQEVDGEEIATALLYNTTDFETYSQQDEPLHEVYGQSSWDRMDFYPVATVGDVGVDTSAAGPTLKHVLKTSVSSSVEDYYAIGNYDYSSKTWTPSDADADLGVGLKYDYGNYYASKTFYDVKNQRRVLFGFINETDNNSEKGWGGVQAIPRSVLLDTGTGSNLRLWPVGDIEGLRKSYKSFGQVRVDPGQIVNINVDSHGELDIVAEFEVNRAAGTVEDYDCSNGAADRSSLGPFGFLVLTDDTFEELTPVYFRPIDFGSGNVTSCFCTDTTRSSKADDVQKVVYGTTVPVFRHEKYTMRVIIDHSVVESFAQHGRKVISTRVYPTRAIYGKAGLYLFNNATGVSVKANLKVYGLRSAYIGPVDSVSNI